MLQCHQLLVHLDTTALRDMCHVLCAPRVILVHYQLRYQLHAPRASMLTLEAQFVMIVLWDIIVHLMLQ